MTIEQGDNESLWSFITHFNREALTVDEMDDKLLLAAFHNRVSSDLFIHKFYDQEPQTMVELVHSTPKLHESRRCDHCQKEEESKVNGSGAPVSF